MTIQEYLRQMGFIIFQKDKRWESWETARTVAEGGTRVRIFIPGNVAEITGIIRFPKEFQAKQYYNTVPLDMDTIIPIINELEN